MPGNLEVFLKAFISVLVLRGKKTLQPKAAAERTGFKAVVGFLASLDDDELQTVLSTVSAPPSKVERKRIAKEIKRIANFLKPSAIGSYDNLVSSFRDLQLSFTDVPNYKYRRINFSVSRGYAESYLEQLDPAYRVIAETSAEKFLSKAGRGGELKQDQEALSRAF